MSVCQSKDVEILEMEVMPEHVHLLIEVDPQFGIHRAVKAMKALKKLNNKEQRWMKDKDHKVSRRIVNFAKDNKVSTIQLEALSGIRQTARTSRKNNQSLHSWSFYRLTQFIKYKAELAGIKVVFVDPKYTSQTCPICGKRNYAKDRKYKCPCGFETHRDILGARNIITAPVIGGNSLSA